MILSRIASGIPLALARLRGSLARPPRHGYIGAHGQGSLGDDAMFEAATALLPGHRLKTYGSPRQEMWLARARMGGKSYFASVILGGGTLINPLWADQAKGALRQGVPVWTLGTGVGSCGFAQPPTVSLSAWVPLLADFARIGVRGYRSRDRLLELGVSSEVVGDVALALTPASIAAPASPPRIAVNVALPSSGSGEPVFPPSLDGLADALAGLKQDGWEILPVAMDGNDIQPLRALMRKLGLDQMPHQPSTAEDFFDLVGPCTFAAGVRLHLAALACCVGVPPLLLGYRDKCLDFMETMQLTDWHVPLEAPAGEVREKTLALSKAAHGMRGPVHEHALAWKGTLQAYVRRMAPAAGG